MKETKENNINIDVEIKFPFQYIEKYFLGEMEYDEAIDNTVKECDRLIKEYIEGSVLRGNYECSSM